MIRVMFRIIDFLETAEAMDSPLGVLGEDDE